MSAAFEFYSHSTLNHHNPNMSATSGIGPSEELTAAFAQAVESKSTRFLKVSIQNETLVHDTSIPISASFQEDLNILQDDSVLPENNPAYILAKLDDSPDWVAIFYMLYASTRSSLLKTLGSALFVDTIFATSKADLTPDAYIAHQQHLAAPKPLSDREKELSELRLAENAAADYAGSRVRVNHIGTGVGLNWSSEAEEALAELARDEGSGIVILSIDTQSETLKLHSEDSISVAGLPSALPASEPCFAFFAWVPPDSRRQIVFLYSCPSNSAIKNRMIYSSASTSTYQASKTILSSSSPTVTLASRKIETSDPKELDEAFLIAELGLGDSAGSVAPANRQAFARPKGPGRRR
ncbi:hypothetical protein CC1G_05083 [Coprinopsis cinerea okayama7|uniref:ADF-H domain-containing protein n=1 Tax=Coprinopsis cinerea (strain Okayama-7 / 130 / ATCC MYA-4618 / FGSC 9003) TaxID=240176 RepID=A8NG97_COPC7|nr:hypothetical protein CC1G_05083 [Coprinopsis cinerea okayama7\|eukprot:XP_001833383.2 hypothetical protein CC1G_05083 [Coprinopsis cinerea okayama7\